MTGVLGRSIIALDAVDATDVVDGMAMEMDMEIIAATATTEFDNNHDNEKIDFEDFERSMTLTGVTVEEAQASATAAESTTPTDHQFETSKSEEADDNKKFVTPKDFELLKVIGMGAFGKVIQVRNKQSSQILAMKIISKRQLRKKSGYIENVQAERNILKRVDHPFVVKMHCSFQTRDKLFILMDFLAGGELFLRLGKEGIFLEASACFYVAEIILGVEHLHCHGILHRDLKPENILLCNDGHICLTDFGLAKDFGTDWSDQDGTEDQERARTICGTQEYMAPEMVANKGYGKAADYWSLGCILYEMLNGLPPFSSKQGSKELFRKIMSEKIKMPPGSTAAACKLMKGLLNRNPDARLGVARSTMFEVGGVAGLKRAPFFAKIDWCKLERKELEPPYDLNVDNDYDLRNFHNEFTDMPLPRSVRDLCSEDHKPRRVTSDTFRGFSFIQQDFTLPNRDIKEEENYWEACIEDGGSDSDLASSKCGTEEVLSQPTQPVKKKRPPRKRKKKKNKEISMETASMASSIDITPTPSDVESDVDKVFVGKQLVQTNAARIILTTASLQSEDRETTCTETTNTNPATAMGIPKTEPRIKKDFDTWKSASTLGRKNRNKVAGYSAASSAKGDDLSHTHRQYQSQLSQQKNQQSPNINSSVQQFGSNNQGSWSARLQKSALSSQPATTSSAVPPPPPPTPPSPSSDWRQHASPQVQRAIHRGSFQSNPDKKQAWPSLNDFPAAPSLSTSTTHSNPIKPLGAWGKR